MKNKFKIERKKAFTLVEILLSLVIMAVISGLSVPIVFNLQYNNELKDAAVQIDSLIRKAENLALSGSFFDKTGGVPTYGYGINFSSNNEVILFANGSNGASYQYDDVALELYSDDDIIKFNDSIGIVGFTTDLLGAIMPSSYGPNILFVPPDGEVKISDKNGTVASSTEEISIYITHEYIDKCYVFTINKFSERYFKNLGNCP